MSTKVEKWRKKPVDVLAVRFDGRLGSVERIMYDLGATVLYVPRGYEHSMRKEQEFDRSNGHILDDAPAFLVIDGQDEFVKARFRVDVGDYVLRDENCKISFITSDELENQYVNVVDINVNVSKEMPERVWIG